MIRFGNWVKYVFSGNAAPMLAAFLAGVLIVEDIAAQGFPNIPRIPGELIVGPIAPEQGRTAIVAWHGERIVSVPESPGSQPGADRLIRVVDINDLDGAGPQVTIFPVRTSGFHAHGYYKTGDYLFVGPHCLGEALDPCDGTWPHDVWANALRIGGAGTAIGTSVLRRGSIDEETGLLLGSVQRAGTQSPWGLNDFWTYNTIEGNMWLGVRRNNEWVYDWSNGGAAVGPAVKATWDHLGLTGVTGFPFIMGNILLVASDQAGTGVASYDISDLANPVLLDVLKEGNPGGYWPEIYGHYIFFPRRDGEGGVGSQAGFMVVDFSDPTDLKIVANRNLEGSNQYVTFQDEYAFMNRYKIDMRTFDVVVELQTIPDLVDASQFALPVGNLVVTGGYGSDGPGLAIFAHQAEPDTRSPYVAYHVPVPDQTNYPLELPITLSIPETLKSETIVDGVSLILRPLNGAPVATWHAFGQGKLLTVTPQQPLLPDTTYELILSDAIEDAAGNGLEPYSFRFSTGSALAGGNQSPIVTTIDVNPNPPGPGQEVSISWAGMDPDSDPIEFRVDLGDGTPRGPWTTNTNILHSYVDAGHYQLTLQVRDDSGAVSASSITITVADTPALPGRRSSSLLAHDVTMNRLYTVNPDNDTVTAISLDSESLIWEAPVGRHPKSIAQANDNTLWVTCRDSDSLYILNANTGATLQVIVLAYGAAPVAVVPVPGSASMLVSLEGLGALYRYDATTRNQTGSLDLGPTPRAIAVNASGTRALITRFISAEDHAEVYDVSLAGPMSLSNTIVLRRDRSQDGAASSRGVPNYLAHIEIDPHGDYAWVVAKKDNTTRGNFFGPTMTPGQDTTVRAMLCLIDLGTGFEDYSLRLDIDNSDSPSALSFSALGDYAYISLQGNNQIAVLDVLEFLRQDTPGVIQVRWPTGLAPQAVTAIGQSVYAKNFMGRSVTRLDAGDFLQFGSLNVPAVNIDTVQQERLHPEVLQGKQLFYNASDPRMSAEGYISCATCHIDGGHDGRTWDFTNRGEGFRNTTDLRGRSGMAHGNVHWSGNFDEIQDFENDIRDFFGGTGFLSDSDFAATSHPLGASKTGLNEDLDALAAYVSSLGAESLPRTPARESNGNLSEAAQRGQAVFLAQSCNTCHIPSEGYTDRQMHDVGTLRASSGQRLGGALTGIDTPTLLGIHASAPYFHDGSAATLEEVFTTTGGRLVQAEDATLNGGAFAEDIPWFPMKEWHGSQFVLIGNTNNITFGDVQSTIAGPGYIEVRYSVLYGATTLHVSVNGAPDISTPLAQTPNLPSYVPTDWRRVRIPVSYQAGNNSFTLRRLDGGQLMIDDVLFSTPDDAAQASAHFRQLDPGDLDDLVAYLGSLDAQNAPQAAVQLSRGDIIPAGGSDAYSALESTEEALTYTLTNTGAAVLDLGAFHVTVDPPGAAWISQQPPAQLAPGESASLELRTLVPWPGAVAEIGGWTSDPSVGDLEWVLVLDTNGNGDCIAQCLVVNAVGPISVNRQIGDSVTFAVNAMGAGTISYQWYYENGNKMLTELGGEINASLTLTNLDIEDSGEYYCVVSDMNDMVQGPTFNLNVVASLPAANLFGLAVLAALCGGVMVLRGGKGRAGARSGE